MRRYLPHIKTAATALVILVVSLGDAGNAAKPVYKLIPHADKVFHVFMYFALTIVMLWQFRHLALRFANVAWFVLAAFAYGVIIELLQKYLTATRSFEYADILFNLAGIAIATAAFPVLRSLFRRSC